MFATLSDRLADTFKNLRGKGRLSEADIDATAREIRIALLEADVALPVVRQFISAVKERAQGADVSQALNPAQQIIKIVYEELIAVLGGEARRLQFIQLLIRSLENFEMKRLGCQSAAQMCSRDCPRDAVILDLFDRLAHACDQNRRTRISRGDHDPIDFIMHHQRPHSVMHGDDFSLFDRR